VSDLSTVLGRAFHQARAAEANQAIAAQREQHTAPGKDTVSYEVVVSQQETLEALAQRVLPRLVYFLDCRGLKLDAAAGVFLSLFVGETLYFVHASDFVAALAPASGLSLAELVEKYGAASV
jgi:hypothetical protein